MSKSFTKKLFLVFERYWHSAVYYLSLTDTFHNKPMLDFTLGKNQQCLITAMIQDPFRTPNRSKAVLYTLSSTNTEECYLADGHQHIHITCKEDLQFCSSGFTIHLNKQHQVFLSQYHPHLCLEIKTFRVFF